MTTTQHTGVATVRASYAAFATGDIPAVLALWDPDIVWTESAGSPDAGTYRGARSIVDDLFSRIPQRWARFTVTPDEFLQSGDVVIALGWYDGEAAGTARPLRARFAHVFRLTGDRITAFEQVADTARFVAALARR